MFTASAFFASAKVLTGNSEVTWSLRGQTRGCVVDSRFDGGSVNTSCLSFPTVNIYETCEYIDFFLP